MCPRLSRRALLRIALIIFIAVALLPAPCIFT